jgi:membrane protein DedA with SNARE-associated domain
MADPPRTPTGRRRDGAPVQPDSGWRWRSLWPALVVGAILLAIAVLEGDVPEEFADLRAFVGGFLDRYGAVAALGLLYVEESGVPLPVPGDVYIVYLGSVAGGSPSGWVAAWLAIIAVVVGGASNLYLASRRWGPRLLSHRFASVLHLDPERVERARVWFDRWGPLAIIFGRHIPGFRIPITVVAGTFGVPYRQFAPSVAVSTAIWAAFWLVLGARFGRGATDLLKANPWIYVVAVAAVVLVLAAIIVRLWRSDRGN